MDSLYGIADPDRGLSFKNGPNLRLGNFRNQEKDSDIAKK